MEGFFLTVGCVWWAAVSPGSKGGSRITWRTWSCWRPCKILIRSLQKCWGVQKLELCPSPCQGPPGVAGTQGPRGPPGNVVGASQTLCIPKPSSIPKTVPYNCKSLWDVQSNVAAACFPGHPWDHRAPRPSWPKRRQGQLLCLFFILILFFLDCDKKVFISVE